MLKQTNINYKKTIKNSKDQTQEIIIGIEEGVGVVIIIEEIIKEIEIAEVDQIQGKRKIDIDKIQEIKEEIDQTQDIGEGVVEVVIVMEEIILGNEVLIK